MSLGLRCWKERLGSQTNELLAGIGTFFKMEACSCSAFGAIEFEFLVNSEPLVLEEAKGVQKLGFSSTLSLFVSEESLLFSSVAAVLGMLDLTKIAVDSSGKTDDLEGFMWFSRCVNPSRGCRGPSSSPLYVSTNSPVVGVVGPRLTIFGFTSGLDLGSGIA